MEYSNLEFIIYATNKSSFENLVASGNIKNSQIGLIGDTGEIWINGTFYPFASNGGGSTGNWNISFELNNPENDATKYTIYQNDSHLDILVPKITVDESSFISINPTTTQVQIDGENIENIISKIQISNKTQSIDNATSSNNGLATANDVKTHLSKYQEKGTPTDLATDLTGVLEPTPQKFTYRSSSGSTSIRDDSAVITTIKGNSCMWEQKIASPSEGSWIAYTPSYLTLEYIGNEITATVNSGVTITNPYEFGLLPGIPNGSIVGHKYLFCAMVKASYLNSSLGNNFSFEHDRNTYTLNPPITSTNTWTQVFRIWTSNADNQRLSAIRPPWAYTAASSGNSFSVKGAMLFDLTLMFGSGKEPSSLDEFKQYFPLDYYHQSDVTPTGVNIEAIKTVGFNNFNKKRAVNGVIASNGDITNSAVYYVDTFKILPNTIYYVKDACNGTNNISCAYYDSEMSLIARANFGASSSNLNASSRVTTPVNAAYMRVCCHSNYINTCCVNISHSSVHNGEYKEYKENTLVLPEIRKYFPQGMHGINDVYDELSNNGVIKRFGVLRLDELSWEYQTENSLFYANFNKHKINGNGLCNNYLVTNNRIQLLNNGELSFSSSAGIYISDSEYDSVSPEFLEKMSYTHLIYELNNEEYITLSTPIQLDYWVSDWGTEEAVSSNISMPFTADIIYAFNAEGRIRDNEKNIEILEKRTVNTPYVITSYTAHDFTTNMGTIQTNLNPKDLQHGELSRALKEFRPIYLKMSNPEAGFYGAVAMKYCYEEDLIYFSFFNPLDNNTYRGEINAVEVTYDIE